MKIIKWIPYGVAAAGAGAVAAGLYMLGSRPVVDEAAVPGMSDEAAMALAADVMQSKCADCHGPNAKASVLLNLASGGLMGRHVKGAQRSFTMVPDETVRPALTNLYKMDFVLNRGHRMPPLSYNMVHWGSSLTRGDIALLRRVFSPEVAAANLKPIQPAEEPADAREAAKIMLGHLLFNDPRLSTNNGVACASCHVLTKGGTDNLPKSEGVPGPDGLPQHGGVNAPTVFNAANHIRQFWDGRAADLKEQAGGPPLNPVEMGYSQPEDWKLIAEKLSKDNELVAYFSFVYPDEGITGDTITDAIAAYEKSTFVTPDSAFDLYLKGQKDALTDQQVAGLEAFKSAGCATCHSGAAMGGASFEYINTFADLRDEAAPSRYKEGAHGLEDFTKKKEHRDLFRVPTLRNVVLTAPYFHTGTVDKLEDAVRIMFETQTEQGADEQTIKDVTAFLEAQTGKLNGIPLDKLKPEDVAPEHITVAQ